MTQIAYRLTESQESVVEWLLNLPRAYMLDVRVKQQINPISGGTLSPTVEIHGGSGHSDTATKCFACEHRFYDESISITFQWYRGRFKEARVQGEYRRTFKSISAAQECATKMIETAALKRAEHERKNEELRNDSGEEQ